MEQGQFLNDIFEHFRKNGRWPAVRSMQFRYGPQLNVRLFAAQLGLDLVVCEGGPDGIIRLTVRALSVLPAATDEMALYVRATRAIADLYAKRGAQPVSQAELQSALGISGIELLRLGGLLRDGFGPWAGSSWSPDGMEFSITPSEDALFYTTITDYRSFEAVRAQVDRERQRILELFWQQGRHPTSEANTPQLPEWNPVDRQIAEMRARFAVASTEEQFQAVGLLCRKVLISLAQAAYDAKRHSVQGQGPVSSTDAKRRLIAFFEIELAGSANEEARRHAKAAVDLAVALQHKRTADYRTTALCIEGTLSVVRLVAIVTEAS